MMEIFQTNSFRTLFEQDKCGMVDSDSVSDSVSVDNVRAWIVRIVFSLLAGWRLACAILILHFALHKQFSSILCSEF